MLYHHKQNVLYTRFDDICEIKATIAPSRWATSPGLSHDASDAAQLAELHTLGTDRRARGTTCR